MIYGIPWQLREAVGRMLAQPARVRTAMARAAIRRSTEAHPVLGLGALLAPGRFIHGGAVKLLTLRGGFAVSDEVFNVLYVVSSALPDFPDDLVAACEAKGIPLVWNQNGVGYPAWAGRESERFNAPMRRLRGRAAAVIYQSEFCRRSAERFLGPCGVAGTTLLNPVDLVKFSPVEEQLVERPLRLLAMGTQNYRGRVVAALQALARLRSDGVDASLTIAGNMLWRGAADDVANEAAALGIGGSVKRVGAFSQDEAVELYRSHHILLHPKFMDPCPTVVAEALACGLPVVAPASGGIPEMVDDSCSRLVAAPEDWESPYMPSGADLADAVAAVAADLPRMAGNARRTAEARFDSARWIEAHREIFSRVLA